MASQELENLQRNGRGGKLRLVAFSFVWAAAFAVVSVGLAYVAIKAMVGGDALELGRRDPLLQALPGDANVIILADFEETTAEERAIFDAVTPELRELRSGRGAFVLFEDAAGEPHRAIFFQADKESPSALKALFPWNAADGIYLAAAPDTARLLNEREANEATMADMPGKARAFARLAALSPLIGIVDAESLLDLPAGIDADGSSGEFGIALRSNSRATTGFAMPLTDIAATSRLLGLRAPALTTRQPAPALASTAPTVLEIAGTDAMASLLAVFSSVEEKRRTFGTALVDADTAETAFASLLERPFTMTTASNGTDRLRAIRMRGVSADTVLDTVKRYLEKALPIAVPRKLPDSTVLQELITAQWPAFSGEGSAEPRHEFVFENEDVSVAIIGDMEGATIYSPKEAATTIQPSLRAHLPLRNVCKKYLTNEYVFVDLSTLVNTKYTQLFLGQGKLPIGLKMVFAHVDNSVLFCE